jgi:NAD-dependent SIR2 family protein deacetylase
MSENSELSAAAAYSIEFARQKLEGRKILALTGAGISTDSGIPDYRGAGRTPRHPMTYDSFMGSPEARIRYWSRSFVGWNRIGEAKPNQGHFALAAAEKSGLLSSVITQNVDQLHQKAGSRNVIDLHGRLDQVRCMGCGLQMSRYQMDDLLTAANPLVTKDVAIEFTPDGDAEIEATEGFSVPACPSCGGILKPDVVFFGESVPVERVAEAMQRLDQAQALLVAGTSLAVNSGLRFARRAAKAGIPIVIVNIGPTKADELAIAKIEANTSAVLERLLT